MKHLSKIALTAFAIVVAGTLYAQSVKVLTPQIGSPNNYSKEQQTAWQNILNTDSKLSAGKLEYDQLKPQEKIWLDSLEMGYGPRTEGPGCSWYCGGQFYKVTAGSSLKANSGISYKPENLHDFSLFTAWAPDSIAGPIGQKINFHFKPLSPRVNSIVIYNGYIKTIDLFKANGRVKKFALYINNVYYATLDLADTTASQSFSIPPVRSNEKGKDLVLTLEIKEIYKGNKYPDVLVSEVNFDGIDVH